MDRIGQGYGQFCPALCTASCTYITESIKNRGFKTILCLFPYSFGFTIKYFGRQTYEMALEWKYNWNKKKPLWALPSYLTKNRFDLIYSLTCQGEIMTAKSSSHIIFKNKGKSYYFCPLNFRIFHQFQ